MKIVEILTAINESSTLNWLDKIKLVEGYHNNGNLMESNSETKIKQFNSLLDLSIEPVVNKTYIVTSLMLLNDNLLQFETPIVGKFIGYDNGFEFIDNQDNKKTFPPKITKRLKSTTETFIFDGIEKYNKFRTILKLSWDFDLPSFNHSELSEDSDNKVTDIAQLMIDRYSGLSYTPYERAGDHAMGYDSSDPRYKYWTSVQDEIRRIEGVENTKDALLKFKTINLESSQIETYAKKYFECYGIDQPHGKFISNIKRFSKINESVDIAPFLDLIQRVDSKKSIKVHDKFSVLEFEIIFAYKEINCRGFITPKEVAVIKLHNDGTINYIKFTDGDRYPRLTPARYEGKPITYASYFTDSKDAQHALTAITLAVPDGWDLDVSDIKQSVSETKRKSRKRKVKSKSVYSGWWGGYYGDNSSGGESGGGE